MLNNSYRYDIYIRALESILFQDMGIRAMVTNVKPVVKNFNKKFGNRYLIFILYDYIRQISGWQSVSYFPPITCKSVELYLKLQLLHLLLLFIGLA